MKKIILIFALLLLFSFSPIYAKPVHAENTTLNITKFYGLSVARENQTFTLFLEINNTGNYSAENVSVVLNATPSWNNSWIISAKNNNTSILEVNKTLTPEFNISIPTQGNYTFSAWIYSNNSSTINSTKQVEIVNNSSIIVKAGKSIIALINSTQVSDNVIHEGGDISLFVTVLNPWNRTIDTIEFNVSGINSSWITDKPKVYNLAPDQSQKAEIKIRFASKGTYDLKIFGIAWTNVSVPVGSTSYDAFKKIGNVTSTWWGFPYNSYTINSVDGIANDWGASKYWSYYKNGTYSSCGVGCAGGMGCPDGDIVKNSDMLELRFVKSEGTWPNLITNPFSREVGNITVKEESNNNYGSSGGGGGFVSTAPAPSPKPKKEPPKARETKKIEVIDASKDFDSTGNAEAELSAGSSLAFNINSETHKVQVDRINDSSVEITIMSEPITLTLNVGEEKKIDIDSDGTPDIIVKVVTITSDGAVVHVSKIEKQETLVENKTSENSKTESTTALISLKDGFSILIGILFISGMLIWYRRRA